MNGKAFVFGDEINTDIIAPSDYFGEDIEVMSEHIFEPIRPAFAEEIEDGDLLIAGDHFGSGSSRESAPAAIKAAGIGAVVAESFSRIYYRNSIAIGLPAIVCNGITDVVSEGDELRVDLSNGVLENIDEGNSVEFDPIPEELEEIFDAGGLKEHYRLNPEGLSV